MENLRRDLSNLKEDQELKVKFLEMEADVMNRQFLKVKRRLQRELATDERKLVLLSDESLKTMHRLEDILHRGDTLKMLAQACGKFETEREKISKYLPISQKVLRRIEKDGESQKGKGPVTKSRLGKFCIRDICIISHLISAPF